MHLPIRLLSQKLARVKPVAIEITRSEITSKLESSGLSSKKVWHSLRVGCLTFPALASLQNVAELDGPAQQRMFPDVIAFFESVQA